MNPCAKTTKTNKCTEYKLAKEQKREGERLERKHGFLLDGVIKEGKVISKAKLYGFSYYCLLIAVSHI